MRNNLIVHRSLINKYIGLKIITDIPTVHCMCNTTTCFSNSFYVNTVVIQIVKFKF